MSSASLRQGPAATGLKPVLEKAIDNDRPAVIDVTIERGSETSPWKYITG